MLSGQPLAPNNGKNIVTTEELGDTAVSRVSTNYHFHDNRGNNIQLSSDKTVAARIESYNQGIVFSSKPLHRNYLFQVS